MATSCGPGLMQPPTTNQWPFILSVLQELADTREKFEMGLGESRFYHGLAKQAQNLTAAGEVAWLSCPPAALHRRAASAATNQRLACR